MVQHAPTNGGGCGAGSGAGKGAGTSGRASKQRDRKMRQWTGPKRADASATGRSSSADRRWVWSIAVVSREPKDRTTKRSHPPSAKRLCQSVLVRVCLSEHLSECVCQIVSVRASQSKCLYLPGRFCPGGSMHSVRERSGEPVERGWSRFQSARRTLDERADAGPRRTSRRSGSMRSSPSPRRRQGPRRGAERLPFRVATAAPTPACRRR
jgi:hypothetical protein